jgi:hypothetical protein
MGWSTMGFCQWFSEIYSEGQAVATLRYAKQKKHESIKNYYDRYLRLCAIISQPPHDIYLREAFKEGLRIKVKMAIISMSWKTLGEVQSWQLW